MNTIKIFVTSFPSLTLHAVNLLLWKKIPSLTPFKIITVKGPGTLTRVFLVGRSGCPTMGGNWVGDFPARPKIWTFPFCWISPPLKSRVLCPSSDDRPHIEKKISLIKQIVTKIFACGMHFQLHNLNLFEKVWTKSFNAKQSPAGLSSRIIPQVSPFLPKIPLIRCCFVASTICGHSPFPWTFMRNPGDGRESYPTTKNFLISHSRIPFNRFTSSSIKGVICSLSNSNFHVITLCKLYL